ncbi:HAD-IA family hydrolase [Rathayibacter sp. YIM 133350]|uniref:HAD family hydrolase n=1 Tax=Rathayibacter sp. YIM 133350 TaxID=3131992 RepID=UPI00307EB55C
MPPVRRLSARIPDGIRAFLFDLDGVLTPTTDLHMDEWRNLFRPFLADRGVQPYTDDDYFAHIDGKRRADGVRDMLAARAIDLPDGSPADGPEVASVHGLGNRKDVAVMRRLHEEGIAPYPASVEFMDAAEAAGCLLAVVSSSAHARDVLEAARIIDRFPVIVDGTLATGLRLHGKPAPDTYLHAATEVGVPASACAVVEDAVSGVAAGRAGGFGLVIGIDRGAGIDALTDAGADLVVRELDELLEGDPA